MHLYFWIVLTAILLTSSSGASLQTKNTFVLSTTPNITTLTENEVNPDHYNVAGTDIWLQVRRPYGAFLPNAATLLCLANIEAEFAEEIVDGGDRPLGGSYTKSENDINVFIQVTYRMGFLMSTAESAILGVYQVMTGIGGPGTRTITVIVNDQAHGVIGRIVVSWAGYASGTAPMLNKAPAATTEAAPTTSERGIADNEAIIAPRATTSMRGVVANLTSANITAPLTPDHYVVPGTSVYVGVIRPYGDELPHETTISLLLSAAVDLYNIRKAEGDVLLPLEWSYRQLGLLIRFSSRSFNRPHLSTLQAGIVGLIDLMEEESVVGTKEITYVLGVETQGGMGIGRVNWVGDAANGGNETWQEVAATVATSAPSKPLSLGGVETGLVSTS